MILFVLGLLFFVDTAAAVYLARFTAFNRSAYGELALGAELCVGVGCPVASWSLIVRSDRLYVAVENIFLAGLSPIGGPLGNLWLWVCCTGLGFGSVTGRIRPRRRISFIPPLIGFQHPGSGRVN